MSDRPVELYSGTERLSDRSVDELIDVVSRYLPILSHDVRTPMTALKGSINLLSSGFAGQLSDKQLRFVDICDRNTEFATLLVQDVVDLIRLELDIMERRSTELDVLAEVRDFVEQAAKITSLPVSLDMPNGPVRVEADRGCLRRVISALVRFTQGWPEITTATIRVRSERDYVELVAIADPVKINPQELIDTVPRARRQVEGRLVTTGLELRLLSAAARSGGAWFGVEGGLGEASRATFRWSRSS